MNLVELANKDLDSTLTSKYYFGQDFELFIADSWVILSGQINRIASIRDPSTNLRTVVNRTAITVKIADLTAQNITLEDNLPVKFLDTDKALVTGVCKNMEYDRTLGFVTFQVEKLPDEIVPTAIQKRRGIF
jgi:hypothetical protein